MSQTNSKRSKVESTMSRLRQNNFISSETFEQYLQRLSNQRFGKRVYFACNNSEAKDSLYQHYLQAADQNKQDKVLEHKQIKAYERELQDLKEKNFCDQQTLQKEQRRINEQIYADANLDFSWMRKLKEKSAQQQTRSSLRTDFLLVREKKYEQQRRQENPSESTTFNNLKNESRRD